MSLLVGQKDICHYLGNISWRTVRRWIKDGLPVVQRNGGPPRLLTDDVAKWNEAQFKKNKKR